MKVKTKSKSEPKEVGNKDILNLMEKLEEVKKLLELDKLEKDMLLTEDQEQKGLAYEKKLKEILEFTHKLKDKQKNARDDIKAINNKIVALNVKNLKTDDKGEIEDIEQEKKELYLQLQSLEELQHTNVFAIVKQTYLKDLQSYEQESRVEVLEFQRKIAEKISFYKSLEDLITIRKLQLASVKYSHPHEVSCKNLVKEIERVATVDYNRTDGWVGDGKNIKTGKVTTAYIDSQYGLVTERNNESIFINK